MKKASFRALGAVCATASLAVVANVVVAPTAHADPATPAAPGDPMQLVYAAGSTFGNAWLVRADGGVGSFPVPPNGLARIMAVSGDGKRLTGRSLDDSDSRIRTVDADGSNPAHIVIPGTFGMGRAFSPDGSTVYLESDVSGDESGSQSVLLSAPADRDAIAQPLLPAQPVSCDNNLSTSTGKYAFTRRLQVGERCGEVQSVMLYSPGTGGVEPAVEVSDAGVEVPVVGTAPHISPDGTRLVYTRTTYTPAAVVELRVLDLATKRSRTVYTHNGPMTAKWSSDGRYLAVTVPGALKRLDPETGQVGTIGNASRDTFGVWANRTVTPSVGVRVYGSNAITTGVATSRFKFDAAGSASGARKANVAVLTRSDAFYDGLAGAGLAGAKGGPMLLTPKEGLASSVSAELARILSPGATVYVLGDEGVVGATVDAQIRGLGLTPKRLAGNTVAETGIAIANESTSAPKEVFVATAAEYYDALAAGAAAGSTPDATVVFSWGNALPGATANYLRGLDRTKTKVTAVGGPAVVALNAASIRIDATADGRTAPDTAKLLAEHSFVQPKAAALATMATWQDALTGGALIAGKGPLLLATQTTLPQGSADYLAARAPSLDRVVAVGGSDMLNDAVAGQAAKLTGPYGFYDFVDSPDGNVKVSIG
ncbi:cell wall-binding repeat-containing protein [Embleya sp. NPDC050493]|uniref:cell wall-binding repeat-containing protein n=1 Tax=Embleya sp. NPDC050493 TaxID=3363989 RepID=UPI0037ACDCFB